MLILDIMKSWFTRGNFAFRETTDWVATSSTSHVKLSSCTGRRGYYIQRDL